MQTTTPCRCVQCSGEFVPDPRVGVRQVTCGCRECQQARHAERCRQWHANNKETTADHYQDVVVPFRQEQPDYQRRWRWGRRLREIREKTTLAGGTLLAALRALIQQAEGLLVRAAGVVLDRAVAVVRSTIATFEQLETSVAELRELGL